MTIHIGATPDQIAETVLLPGDPYRAKWAAETFLSDVALVNLSLIHISEPTRR